MEKVESYRAGYSPEERRRLEQVRPQSCRPLL